jgi:predicted aspartyl protease
VTTILAALLTFVLMPTAEGGPATGSRAVRATCDRDGTMRITAALDGDESRSFVVDTGSSLSFVESSIAAALRLPAVGSIASTSTGTNPEAAPIVASRISVAGTNVGPIRIVTGERARLRGLIGRADAGILGMDAIRTLGPVTVDYGACLIVVGDPPSDRRAVKLPLEWHEGRPVVVVSGVGRLVLDSGASMLTLFDGTTATSTFRAASGPQSLVRIRRVTGDLIARLGSLPSLPLGGLDLANVPALVVRSWYDNDPGAPHGLLPLTLFSRVHFNAVEGYAVLSR